MRFVCAILMCAVGLSPTTAGAEKLDPAAKRRLEEFRKKAEQDRRKFLQEQAKKQAAQPVFDASKAPKPEVCFASYILAVRQAKSMQDVLPYLRPSERESLVEYQKTYDPKLAAQRRREYQAQGMDEAAIEHLTAAPFDNALKHHRGIAQEVQTVTSVKVNGDQATIGVATKSEATINGARYTRSSATVEMVGEGKFWYMTTYRPSDFYYP